MKRKTEKILKVLLVIAPIVGLLLAIFFNPTKVENIMGWFSATVLALGFVMEGEP